MNYRFVEEARIEFDEAVDWHELQRVGLGDEWIADVISAIESIMVFPSSFSPMTGVRGAREIRFRATNRFQYLIVYEVLPNEVAILGIHHSRRNSAAWRNRRP